MGSYTVNQVIFRTMGGTSIGYGHYHRCVSLATALIQSGNINVKFIVNKELEGSIESLGFPFMICNDFKKDILLIENMKPDIVVFDSYLSNNDYLKELSKLSELVVFDDNNDIYDSLIPDMIINGNIHANDLEYNKRSNAVYLIGTDYLVMKQEYWISSEINSNFYKKKRFSGIKEDFNILITTGGSDQYSISLKILETLLQTDYKKKVIIGPSYKEGLIEKLENIEKKNSSIQLIYKPESLKKYIQDSDMVITAGGSTVYEVLSLGKYPIVFSLADNQDMMCSKLKDKGIFYIGKYPNIKYIYLLGQVNKVYDLKDNKILKNFNSDVFIDGNGALRVANEVLKLL